MWSLASTARKSQSAVARCLSTATSLPSEWTKLATKELKNKPVDSLIWKSPEGIDVKPIYTAEDTKDLNVAQLSGVFPYTRGVRATMYAARPWTVRQV